MNGRKFQWVLSLCVAMVWALGVAQAAEEGPGMDPDLSDRLFSLVLRAQNRNTLISAICKAN